MADEEKDGKSPEAKAGGPGVNLDRRDVLIGLSTVPALGLFGYAWQRQRSYERRLQQAARR